MSYHQSLLLGELAVQFSWLCQLQQRFGSVLDFSFWMLAGSAFPSQLPFWPWCVPTNRIVCMKTVNTSTATLDTDVDTLLEIQQCMVEADLLFLETFPLFFHVLWSIGTILITSGTIIL